MFVGLSGGVDSAVSAALLQQDGYDVTGVFIRIALPGYPCTAGEDKVDAQRVAAHLRIPFLEIDLSKEYQEEVFNTAVKEFSKGNTPNPDTLCNQKIKFGSFYRFAKSQNVDFIATGHYSQIKNGELFAGADQNKDQSYFLWMVPETVLRYTLFPVGSLKKTEVRALAKKFGLPNASRKDSQGLCFLGDISIEDMLERELAPVAGDVLTEAGLVVGKHRGSMLYTLGQRHGFELFPLVGTQEHTDTPPHFVIAKDSQKNTITVSTFPFPRGVSETHLMLADTNWIGKVEDGAYEARYRYRQKLIPAQLRISKDDAEVILQEPHYAPVGQSLVLYEGDRCLGGGIIKDTQLT